MDSQKENLVRAEGSIYKRPSKGENIRKGKKDFEVFFLNGEKITTSVTDRGEMK